MGKDKMKWNRNNKFNGLVTSLFIFFMFIVLALNSYAIDTVTARTCISSGTALCSVGSTINVSFNGQGITACAVTISSSLTANSSTSVLINMTNTSTTNSASGYLNATYTSLFVVEDGNDYTTTPICYNNTNAVSGTAVTVVFDNSIPQTPTSLTPTGDDTTTQTKTFTGTIRDANTTFCYLVFRGTNPGSNQYTMTQTSGTSTCTLTLANIPRDSYTYFIRASDGTNTTDSADASFSLTRAGSTAGARGYANYLIKSGQAVPRSNAPLSVQGSDVGVSNFDFSKELTTPELTKTGVGVILGGVVGLVGIALGPAVIITVPVGAIIGGIIGFIL